jgi:hypothetical protein
LPDEPPAARAERGAHGQLALARAGAHQQQVGDVGARDEQHEADRAEQDDEVGLGAAREGVGERLGEGRAPAVRVGVECARALGHGAHLGVGLPDRDAGAHQAHDLQEVVAAVLRVLRVEGHRRPDLAGVQGELELVGHDADDRARAVVDADGAADDVGVGAEALAPEAVLDEDDGVGAGPALLLAEGAAALGARGEHAEERGRDARAGDALGLLALVEAEVLLAVGGQLLEDAGLLAPVEVVGGRDRVAVVGLVHAALPDHHDPRRRLVRERPQQQRVDDREDGRVRAHAQGHGQHRHGRKPRVLPQHPCREP